MKRDKIINKILAVFFTILSLAWIYPMVMILMNSFKEETTITTSTAFDFVTSENSAGFANYIAALDKQGFLAAFGYSLVITITSVALILVCCSMCAWFIVRVKNRISNILYYLFVFSMVVPFQMLMFTLSNMANTLGFNTPFNICFIYLGFGAGLAVFMFAGFVKTIPLEIEEAATIDGCNPLQTFFHVVLPIMKPTYISVGILETMWVWNDYLLPYLVLDRTKFQTIPILIQYFRGGYGRVEMGPMFACIMMVIIPIVIMYLLCQRYIIDGVVSGAVKG
ncbi:ABC transporter, permease protein [Atopobium sp. BS2]|uniref:carbohydrate ABC transporter permease n=1 Tax=Atopobium sp. BS2 TaxID=936550 RepID=UPI00044BD16A|nr:carbohydrate ABC transporter permease [Atopobium sp. BS2]EWC94020.1 ABC transporter, permease protein [Atopobium sp. BS2]